MQKTMCLKKAIQRLLSRVKSVAAREANPAPLDDLSPLGGNLPKTHQAAVVSLTAWEVVRTVAHKTKLVKTPWQGSDPDIVAFYKAFSKALEARGMPFYAFEFYRSNDRQNVLFKQGVTRARAGQSPHNHGMAVDVVHSTRYWDLTRKEWDVIGAIGLEVARKRNLKITWGGSPEFGFYDPAHWQLADWRKRVRNKLAAHALP